MKDKIKYLIPILAVILLFLGIFCFRQLSAPKKELISYKTILKNQPKLKTITLSGKRKNSTAKQLGITNGLYNVEVVKGKIERFPAMDISKIHPGKSIFVKSTDIIRFSENSKIILKPDKLEKRQNYNINCTSNLVVGKQIPAGTYEIIASGQWARYDTEQKPTQVILADVDWERKLIASDKKYSRSLSIEGFEAAEKDNQKVLITLKDKTLLNINFFYQTDSSGIELKRTTSTD